jgi:hypothetical protein
MEKSNSKAETTRSLRAKKDARLSLELQGIVIRRFKMSSDRPAVLAKFKKTRKDVIANEKVFFDHGKVFEADLYSAKLCVARAEAAYDKIDPDGMTFDELKACFVELRRAAKRTKKAVDGMIGAYENKEVRIHNVNVAELVARKDGE